MERYESLGPVGEGSYGTVLKCRHRDTGRLVAIKKFTDSDDDKMVKKIAHREIKLLRQLRHDNLVNLLEVWKRRRRWYLVFEFVDRTLLDDLEQNPSGLELNTCRQYLHQILRAAAFCHQQNIIHRDIKPENILISQEGVVKLCDFGFARTVALTTEGGVYTDYVATRWYRAPELLVGDIKYSKPVDVWALGCVLLEMLTGQPLFPGDSDLDQIYQIIRCFGNLTTHHQELFYRNPVFSGVRLPECSGRVALQQRFPTITPTALDLAQRCLEMDPERRAQCSELLEHPLFTQDSFHIRFLEELNAKIQKDHRENSTFPKITKNPRKDEGDVRSCRGKDKKQHEGMNEKVNKEKMEKTKRKHPLKVSKTTRHSEPMSSTKQSKSGKVIQDAAQSSMAIKSKAGKATGIDSKKESEIPTLTKTLTLDLSETSRMVACLENNNSASAKPKHEHVLSPDTREDHENTALCATEKSTQDISRLCKLESSQEFEKKLDKTNKKVSKLLKHSTTDHLNFTLSSKPSVESATDWSTIGLPLKSNKDHIEIHTTLFVINQCETNAGVEDLTNQTADSDQRKTSGHPKGPSSNPKPSRSISEMNNSLLPTSKSHTSDLPTQSSTVFMEASPPQSNKVFGSSSKELPEHIHLREDNDIKEDMKILHSSGGEYKWNLESSCLHQQSISKPKTCTETKTTSNERTFETLNVSDKENQENLALTVSVSATANLSVAQTTNTSGSSAKEKQNNTSAFESDVKSWKVPQSKCLVGGEFKMKSSSFSDHMTSTVFPQTQKPTLATDHSKMNENPEQTDKTNISSGPDLTSVTSTETLHLKALTRSSVLHNKDSADLNEFDLSVSCFSSPPPSSSIPLLLPPSSTSLVNSSIVRTHSSAISDHSILGAGSHPRTPTVRCLDKPRHHGGIYSRKAQQFPPSNVTGSLTFQGPEKSQTFEHSFVSDCPSNSCGVAVAKNKLHIHFPDLSCSVLPEVRGREGKQNKGAFKEQRKDKQPLPSHLPAEPQQYGHNNTNTYTPKQT
ncbi:uncharacterized protein LOC115797301 [Archocentrus centrarchus]|uniref:uncharacterized protein LOC115797301 n=1 Tax=Archocentrus centrarchus TaxID=63155 RepID=UPI0011EA0B21|nr:uncharacterized protein LOC115797301 [Archocentrus centrarchus]